jgi:acetyl esterase/lipase
MKAADHLPIPRPPFDPELEAALVAMGGRMTSTFTREMLSDIQQTDFGPAFERLRASTEDLLSARGLRCYDVEIPAHDDGVILVSVIRSANHSVPGPGLYYVHGGGMVSGTRLDGVPDLLDTIVRHDAVLVTVEYRLAPAYPDPFPVEDCYAGLVWMASHADELMIDPDRLVIVGGSAGGGLAAGTALLARDRRGPAVLAQLLMCPMLDDRDRSTSTRQIDGVGVWNRESNITGWTALLGDRKGTADVSVYAAPSRAADLSGLPAAYIDCGSAEVFRDECVAYASALWSAGVQAELHVWAGGFHGFEMVEGARVSRAARAARASWIERVLAAA